ncbi:hypothetical protein N9242_00910 [Vicingaceae bacterium]|nr:hypothetical protein [Vicingaceae bacterium]
MATFHSFSGVDMHAVFGDVQFGELQMVSYKSDREKAPVYTMGSSDPRTIARGKRLITGAVVFVVFERDGLLDVLNNATEQPYLSKEETANYDGTVPKTESINGSGLVTNLAGGSITQTGSTINDVGGTSNSLGDQLTTRSDARTADQLLPFDITLVGANEYGKTTKMVIHGVELMSESGGISIDDLVIEKQLSYIARSLSNWDNGATAATS